MDHLKMHFLLKMEMFHCHISLLNRLWVSFGGFSEARQQRLPRRVCHHDTHNEVRGGAKEVDVFICFQGKEC